MENNYDIFAQYYDTIIGSRSDECARLQELIDIHCPGAKTILELACGTGAILEYFADRYEVS